MRASLAVTLGVLIVVCLVAPAAAPATVRYTSPAGTLTSGTCTNPAGTCRIDRAFTVAASGDEISLAPGAYGSPSTPITQQLATGLSNVTVHAVGGAPARIYSSYSSGSALLQLNGSAATVRDVEVHAVGATTGTSVFVNGTAERVVATSTNGYGCQVSNGSLLDSVCTSVNGDGFNTNGTGTRTIVVRNVTAVGGFAGVSVNADTTGVFDLTLSNVIAIGGAGGKDLNVAQQGGGTATMHVGHSNYDSSLVTGGATFDTSPGFNQATPPAFVDAAGGDFRQTATSPTVDAGVTDPLNGDFDLKGALRSAGARTDIGADEFAPPTLSTDAPIGLSTTGASLVGSVNPNGTETTYHFEYGTSPAYGSRTPDTGVGAATTPAGVIASIEDLQPATTYHLRLVASNASGTSASPDREFTTPSPPGPTPAPQLTGLTQSRPSFAAARGSTPTIGTATRRRPLRGTTFSFRLDQDATVTVKITRKRSGRKVGRACRAPTRANRKRPRCTRFVAAKTLTRTAHVGVDKIAFSGRFGRKAVPVGSYRATFTAANGNGTSRAQGLDFKIVPG
jgi:hypothetical protein